MDKAFKKVAALVGVKATKLNRRIPLDVSKITSLTDAGKKVFIAGVNGSSTAKLESIVSSSGHAISSGGEVKGLNAIVCDTRNIKSLENIKLIHNQLQKATANLTKNGRLIMISGEPKAADIHSYGSEVVDHTIATAIGGFTKAFAKEVGARGITANMISINDNATHEDKALPGTLQFLLSDRSSYITGQFFNLSESKVAVEDPKSFSVAKKRVVVTGASRGIGEQTARLFHAEGANLLLVDHPGMTKSLESMAQSLKCAHLPLDVTEIDASQKLFDSIGTSFGEHKVDIVVHNAGITRDKTFKNMTNANFNAVIEVNLASIARLDQMLLSENYSGASKGPVLTTGGRNVYLSSMSGVAGAFGQTNYSCSKAGVIGYVRSMSKHYASKGIAFNAIAPGFIETEMTSKIPFLARNVARLLNSLVQEGYPVDVAEAIIFFATNASIGMNGQTIRVCGGNLIGA